MEFHLDESVQVLRNTPAALRALLTGVSDPWVHGNYGPETFSPLDVVAHLIHGERTDWLPRTRIIIEHGTSRSFDPFDPASACDESVPGTIDELLEMFATLRNENLDALETLVSSEQLDLQGTHPAFGTVTLRQLLATWTVHDLHHVAQICKAMSHQYGESVGPWRAYLSILRPAATTRAAADAG